jgi:maltooligosyltrehalose trehalohydrolase
VTVDFDEDARWLVLARGPLTVACNLGGRPATVPVGSGEVVLASEGAAGVENGQAVLPPESAIVLLDP